MIEFFSTTAFELSNENKISTWVEEVIKTENFELGEITYVFCDDAYLHKLNVQFLDHDTFTDIISFDSTLDKKIQGEIYISIDRVRDNATEFSDTFLDELHRVLIHGILHFCGYKDKTKEEEELMRKKETDALQLLRSV